MSHGTVCCSASCCFALHSLCMALALHCTCFASLQFVLHCFALLCLALLVEGVRVSHVTVCFALLWIALFCFGKLVKVSIAYILENTIVSATARYGLAVLLYCAVNTDH